jgi:thiol-disulfide isomerase/thioredoxin
MQRLRWIGRLDMYRKIPADLMEGTRRGSYLSYVAMFVLLFLFLFETGAYFQQKPVTDLALDSNKEKTVRVNFNITMLDLKCEYVVIDLVSVLGTTQNVSSYVSKWHVDADGIRQRYQGRNREQKDIALFDPNVHNTLQELYVNGEQAVSLDDTTFEFAKNEQEYLFVDFYAGWCSHCRDLAPTWEILAEVMQDAAEHIVANKQQKHDYSEEELQHALKLELPVMIAKVDCVHYAKLCQDQGLIAYPTLRLFVDSQRWRGGDYQGDRTVTKMTDWLQQIEHVHKTDMESSAEKNVGHAHRGKFHYLADSSNDWFASE